MYYNCVNTLCVYLYNIMYIYIYIGRILDIVVDLLYIYGIIVEIYIYIYIYMYIYIIFINIPYMV